MATLDIVLSGLKAAAEPTRLRILRLLALGQLSVKDLTAILGQSQPRISRHLKMLTEAGLVARFPEGAWVYYQLSDAPGARALTAPLLAALDDDDAVIHRDADRRQAVLAANAEAAQAYFARHAGDWDRMRSLGVTDRMVETALVETVQRVMTGHRAEALLDIGTGTGRILELLADRFARLVGLDASHDMLKVARTNLERAGVKNAQVRHGDLFALPFDRDAFSCITLHQVLHFLDDPLSAIREAARVLEPGGALVVVDLAPHGQEVLRDKHQHRRLGFSDETMGEWLRIAGLTPCGISPVAADGLEVRLWAARDPRIALAGPAASLSGVL